LFSDADGATGGETAFVYRMERAEEAVCFGVVDFDDVLLAKSQPGKAREEDELK